CVAVHSKQPERVTGIPVVFVAIEHNCRIGSDGPAAHQVLKAALIDKIAVEGILYIDMPIKLYSAWNMADFVKQYIFVGLDQANSRVIEMLGHPFGFHQQFWMGITRRSA